MTVFVCVDNNFGLSLFNKRQSKDAELRKYLIEEVKKNNSKLSVNYYTFKQFTEEKYKPYINVGETENLFDNDFVFIEGCTNIDWNKVNKLVFIKWNRNYPADNFLSIPSETEFILDSTKEITSKSHCMTIEEYIRREI